MCGNPDGVAPSAAPEGLFGPLRPTCRWPA